jgi:hypothetical protein
LCIDAALCTALPPEITTVPVEVTTQLEGTELSLSCAATGAPKPTLAWKVGEDLNDITEDDRISVLTSGTETSLSIKVCSCILVLSTSMQKCFGD